jgi:hypothetical protein
MFYIQQCAVVACMEAEQLKVGMVLLSCRISMPTGRS